MASGGGMMREENLKALRERIQASLERARQQPPAPKRISEEDRLARTEQYVEFLFKNAKKKL
jgi:hypothetical protein